jgi:arginine decarboxylase-like protein
MRLWKLLGTLAVVAGLFAAAYGAAETLSVTSGGLQSGVDNTLTCDSDGVTVGFQDFNDDNVWDTVVIYDVDCDGDLEVGVEVRDSSDNVVGKGHNDVTGHVSGGNVTLSLTNALTKAEIEAAESVRVAITQK